MSELLSKQNIWLYLFSVIFSSNLFAFTAQGFVKVFSDGGTKFNDKYVIAFFYSSSCPYCHKFAPTLKRFEQDHGLKVESVTHDGGKIYGFEDALYFPELFNKFNISGYPAVLVVNKKTENKYLLAQGNITYRELVDNFNYVKKTINEELV